MSLREVIAALVAISASAVTCVGLSAAYAQTPVAIQTVNGIGPNAATGNIALSVPAVASTATVGGSLLTAGTCASGTVAVSGATTAMVAVASPVVYPGDGVQWQAYVSSAGTVTVKVCAIVLLTPASSVYNVRVIT